MQNANEESLKEVIGKLLDSYGLTSKLNETKIKDNWEDLMGDMISKHTESIYIKENTLFLKIDSAPLRQELSFSKDKILEIINGAIGQDNIKEVIIR